MALISAVPFRMAPAAAVAAAPWHMQNDDVVQPLPRVLPHWDYNQELELTRSIQIDVAAVLTTCGLTSADPLSLAAVWSCPGTPLRGRLAEAAVVHPGTGTATVFLRGTAEGQALSGELKIDTQLVLYKERPRSSLLSASRAGSILWRDTFSTIVEGEAPRFPVELVDFSRTHWAPPGAAWYLSWNPHDLRQPFLGAVRLMINSTAVSVAKAVAKNEPDPASKAIRSTIQFEIGRALLRGALLSDEFRYDMAGFPEGTVGCVLSRLLGLLFPGDSPEGIKNLMDQQPEYFDAVLQEKLQLFHS
jgi:uncharacterized membrane protein